MRIPAWQAVVYCRSRLEGRLPEISCVFFVVTEYGPCALDALFGAIPYATTVVQNVFIGGEGCVFSE
jgi:hypothetical protein